MQSSRWIRFTGARPLGRLVLPAKNLPGSRPGPTSPAKRITVVCSGDCCNMFSAFTMDCPDAVSGLGGSVSETSPLRSPYTEVELIKISFLTRPLSAAFRILLIFSGYCAALSGFLPGGIAMMSKPASKKSPLSEIPSRVDRITNGFMPAVSSLSAFSGVVVDPLTWKPFLIKALASAKPNHPQPSILTVFSWGCTSQELLTEMCIS